MKKSLLLIATAVLAMTACTKDVAEMDGGANALGGEINVSAAIGENTRTSMTANGDNLDIAWVKGDGIGMFASDANGALAANLKYVAESDAANSKLNADGESIQWGTGTHQFYAYYPYTTATDDATAVPISVPAVQEQSAAGDLAHLQPYAFLYAQKSSAKAESVQLSFQNALSVLEVNLCSEVGAINCDAIIFRADDTAEVLSTEGATINLTTGAINTASATNSNEIKVTLGTPVALDATTPQSFYMMVTPGHAGKRFSIYAVVNGEEVLLGNKGIPAAGLPAGVKATLDLNVPAIDLSANGTANSYIVNKVGTSYKFKATVKGNGATADYAWSGGGESLTKTITEADVTIAPVSAKLLWTTNSATETVVTDVELKEGYIYFKTPASFIDGNCVIAAMDASGEIVWSWHIWALEGYDDMASADNIEFETAKIMDRNLGAMLATEQTDVNLQAKTSGLKYQWGRKDPFPGPAGNMTWGDGANGGQGEPTYSPDGSITCGVKYGTPDEENWSWVYSYYQGADGYQSIASNTFNDDIDGAIAQSVKEPWRWHNDSNGEPFVGVTSNDYAYAWLWGNPTSADEGGKKSIYDPCPVGWKVPSDNMFKALYKQMTKANSYGMTYGESYFGNTGRRRPDNGNIENCHEEANLWVDGVAGSLVKSRYFKPYKTVHHGNWDTYAGYGFSIRCMSESGTIENLNTPVEIDLSKDGTANCYVVNRAGANYKFKANVKGNGYDPITGAPAAAINLEGATAEIIWGYRKATGDGADNTQLNVTVERASVAIDGEYIKFRTQSNMEDGNLAIAVKDSEGNIMWSWHIWGVAGYDHAATAVDVDVHGLQYKIMDRNIGAFCNPLEKASPTEDDYAFAYGLYYQWGRKDPFLCGGTQRSSNGSTWFDFIKNGTLVKSPTFAQSASHSYLTSAYNYYDMRAGHGLTDFNEILTHSIQNPLQFYVSANWVSSASSSNGQEDDWGKLWGNQKDNGNAVKTMYDPCPVGYTVASPEHFKFVTSTGDRLVAQDPTWQLNTPAEINSTIDPNPIHNAPWGLEFFTKGTRTAEGLPADQTTVFLPRQSWIQNNATPRNTYGYICLYSNAPSTESLWGGQPYKMKVESHGYADIKSPSWTYAAEAGCAFAVRCVSENK